MEGIKSAKSEKFIESHPDLGSLDEFPELKHTKVPKQAQPKTVTLQKQGQPRTATLQKRGQPRTATLQETRKNILNTDRESDKDLEHKQNKKELSNKIQIIDTNLKENKGIYTHFNSKSWPNTLPIT